MNKAQVEDVAKAHAVVAELQRRLEIVESERAAAVEAADNTREKMHAVVHERRVAAAAAAVPQRQVMHVEQEEVQRGKPRTSTEDFVVSRQNLASMVSASHATTNYEAAFERFQKLDVDGDGKISVAELVKLGMTEEQATREIEENDADGDGSISWGEYLAKKKKEHDAKHAAAAAPAAAAAAPVVSPWRLRSGAPVAATKSDGHGGLHLSHDKEEAAKIAASYTENDLSFKEVVREGVSAEQSMSQHDSQGPLTDCRTLRRQSRLRQGGKMGRALREHRPRRFQTQARHRQVYRSILESRTRAWMRRRRGSRRRAASQSLRRNAR